MNLTRKWLERTGAEYGLDEDAVREAVRQAVSGVLAEAYGCEVEAHWKGESLDVWRIEESGGDLRIAKIYRIPRRLFRRVVDAVEMELKKTRILQAYEGLRYCTGTVVRGYVSHIFKDRIIVDIPNSEFTGFCHISHQPPSERGRYLTGDYISFYVLKAVPVLRDTVPDVEIHLSRTSIKLPELLLKDELHALNREDIKVKCIKRISGAYSLIRASARCPVEAIRSVSEELRERVVVRYGSFSF